MGAGLRVQINYIDYILAQPGPHDHSSLPKVPVIRIFGPSSVGSKACVHIHQVYPYFFVEYPEKMNPDNVNNYISRLWHSLNRAMAISLKRNAHSRDCQFVRAIVLVKGVHFYGFHSSWSPFLKIYIADPALVYRAVAIMQSGTVMQTRFRIFESHLSFILQFVSDFGLYGCGWIDLREVFERGNEDDDRPGQASGHSVDGSDDVVFFERSPHFRQSRMTLEVDAAAHHILNRHLLTARNIHHKLEIPAPPLPKEPLVPSVRELWEDERNRRLTRGLSPSPEMPLDPSAGSRGKGGEWVAEARWWDEIHKRIGRERPNGVKEAETSSSWERWVMTTFESVEAIWEEEFKVWKPRTREDLQGAVVAQDESTNPFATASLSSSWGFRSQDSTEEHIIDVDEAMLTSQEMPHFADHGDADWDNLLEDSKALAESRGRNFFEDDDPLNPEDGPPPDLQGEIEAQGDPHEVQTCTPVIAHAGPSVDMSGAPVALDSSVRNTSTSQPKRDAVSPFADLEYEDHGQLAEASTADVLVVSSASAARHRQEITTKSFEENGEIRPLKKYRVIFHPSVDLEEDPKTPSSSPSRGTQRSAASDLLVIAQPAQRITNVYVFARISPSASELASTTDYYNIPSKMYGSPHYSKITDAPERPREYAGLVYHLKGGDGLGVLEPWDGSEKSRDAQAGRLENKGITGWEFVSTPPSVRIAKRWLESDADEERGGNYAQKHTSQIGGPTQANPFGLKGTPVISSKSSSRQRQDMSILCLEVFACSRENRVPDPDVDQLSAVFYSFQSMDIKPSGPFGCETGLVAVENTYVNSGRLREYGDDLVLNELDLINRIVDIVVDLDPDVLVGWEVQAASWGYLNARGWHYGFDIGELVSRATSRSSRSAGNDQWGMRNNSTFKVVGRHVLNLWRIMRSEQNLNVYSFENVAFHILRRRVAKYSASSLTRWYSSNVPAHTVRLIRYFTERTSMVLEMISEIDVITKTAEFARVFGVDFFSVISRGSQFKVESFMSRIAKPESFVLLSPSKQDVGKQNAAECMPLIMEPLSAFYNSPLLVLDFQSLYPSVMIAYNYCYSTCLGRVVDFKARNKFGVTELNQPPGLLDNLKDHINVAPNGIMYVNKEVRQGLLGRMLTELLDTRIMVKQAMKRVQDDKALRRILDARQLGLKFIANVTYGYTSATYSGRMPAVEIADSIVQTGRETLEKAIRIIDSTRKWGAKVVYGDTDSLFIYLRGKTKEQAFRIGQDIADTITLANPTPIKLKFEKVYLPCVLMAKKRYVGFKYENPDDEEPVFDAKGIETIRRDGVPAQQKMTETCLKILFRTQDLSQVKEYCWSSWMKILDNRASVQDFIFAKEVKMGTYSDKVPPPPGVTVAARRMIQDENNEPQYGERVPYLITRGEPNTRLVDRAVAPEELLNNRHLHIDAAYYISRVLIPPLERIFNLVGADVRSWYDEMPKTIKADHADALAFSSNKERERQAGTNRFKIDEHFRSSQCFICGCLASEGICDACRLSPQETVTSLLHTIRGEEKRLLTAQRICSSCTATAATEPIECVSIDCPWLFERKRLERRMDFLAAVENRVRNLDIESERTVGF